MIPGVHIHKCNTQNCNGNVSKLVITIQIPGEFCMGILLLGSFENMVKSSPEVFSKTHIQGVSGCFPS